jgi:hypothetical protein
MPGGGGLGGERLVAHPAYHLLRRQARLRAQQVGRREQVGMGAVTDIDVLDLLLGLPDLPVRRPGRARLRSDSPPRAASANRLGIFGWRGG